MAVRSSLPLPCILAGICPLASPSFTTRRKCSRLLGALGVDIDTLVGGASFCAAPDYMEDYEEKFKVHSLTQPLRIWSKGWPA